MAGQNLGALVLAGGRASRLGGVEKALLTLDGVPLLRRLEGELAAYEERLLSTNHPGLAGGTGFVPVADRVPGRGPMEGIASALALCRSPGLLVLPCDMPRFSAALGEYLCSFWGQGWDAWVCRASDGVHPLCGVYLKSALPALEACLGEGQYRVRAALARLNSGELDISRSPFPDETFANINTAEDLAAFSQGAGEGRGFV